MPPTWFTPAEFRLLLPLPADLLPDVLQLIQRLVNARLCDFIQTGETAAIAIGLPESVPA